MSNKNAAPPQPNDDLGWALAALDLVRNHLIHDGHKETDDPETCSTMLWNLRAAVVSIKHFQSLRPEELRNQIIEECLDALDEIDDMAGINALRALKQRGPQKPHDWPGTIRDGDSILYGDPQEPRPRPSEPKAMEDFLRGLKGQGQDSGGGWER